MMEENKTVQKKKGGFRPNIIDFLIVVVLLGAIAGIAVRMGVVDKISMMNSVEEARVEFIVRNINHDSADFFVEGDAFYSTTHNCYFGTYLKTKQNLPARTYMTDINGQVVAVNYPDKEENSLYGGRIDLTGIMSCSGAFSQDGFLLGGTSYIAPGSEVKIQSRNIAVTVTVLDIQPVETDE